MRARRSFLPFTFSYQHIRISHTLRTQEAREFRSQMFIFEVTDKL